MKELSIADSSYAKQKKETIALGLAYSSMGAEYEHLKDNISAIEAYEQGLQALNEMMLSKHPLYRELLKRQESANAKMLQDLRVKKGKLKRIRMQSISRAKSVMNKSVLNEIPEENSLNCTKVSIWDYSDSKLSANYRRKVTVIIGCVRNPVALVRPVELQSEAKDCSSHVISDASAFIKKMVPFII